ncbi:signal transduction histidine kinase [Microbacterium resistens]|uniref:histidine kinase n=1 Tax=Microbacterium resistens TaxID=156977 RepID=A0ABU1SBQ5_9MICO|nr:histidine kinase [Microbacterium resistens]MDR6866991.1 signal transduction histidine kinase [Microbacterium resistens]
MEQARATESMVVPAPPSFLPFGRGRIPRSIADACGIALLSIAASALGFTGMWDLFRLSAEGASPWWALVFSLPGCVLVAFRDRIPILALVLASGLFAGDLVTSGGLGSLVVLLDVLWHAVHRALPRVRRRIAAVLLVITAAFLIAALSRTADLRVAILVTLQVATLFGTDYWWAVAVGRAEEVTALERDRAADATREAIRDEREEMARELHDLVAGHVSAMAIRAEAALSTPPDEARDRAALRAVRDASLDAHGALRSMISVLREGEGALSPAPRLEDIGSFVRTAEAAGLRVTLDDRLGADAVVLGDAGAPGIAGVPPLPAIVGQTAARIVREALVNSMRHAAKAEVDVRLWDDGDRVRILVDSRGGTGASHPALTGSGTGLAVLAERVRALGGEFAAGPRGDDGWSVRAALLRSVA